MEFIEVGNKSDLENGRMRMYTVGGREILVARVGDDYYAADNRCPHLGGNLSGGRLEGTVVTCPRHHSQFDLKDGRNVLWTDWTGIKVGIAKVFRSPRPLKTHRVKVEGDRIMVEMEKPPVAVA
jgi:3-phenylpropionate/trans-cinnamate dioxygenase ferredoxin subunit